MSYYFSQVLAVGFEDALQRTTEALKREGFGIISDIDVRDTFRKKLNREFRPYRILGACNPELAFQALSADDKIGTMLPCNVVVQQLDDGRTEVAAIDPVASMQAVPNLGLAGIAAQARQRLQRALQSLVVP